MQEDKIMKSKETKEELNLTKEELENYVEALDIAEETWEKDRPIRKGRKKKNESNTL